MSDTTNNSVIRKSVIAAVMTALVCIATMIIKIPTPMRGYINLGDPLVLFCGYMLSPMYGFLAAGLGSALADVFSGYMVYAPATFVIKGIMALVAGYLFRIISKRGGKTVSRMIGGLAAEVIMIGGYLAFEGLLYGFGPSLVNVPANGIQGLAGLILGVIFTEAADRSHIKIK